MISQDFTQALEEKYLSYALSTIVSRSLPDVRDGLKPVHRRLLYAMWQLKLDPQSGFKKCARVVGDVIGKFHPHGDVAVYDSLVRLSQDFAVRYPLVEGQGNFGSIDGDNAAAMRYTEAKLTQTAMFLLQDIDMDVVVFAPTYDSQELEPLVMPSNFPNILANGSEGIAVGMATFIPPHNIIELCDAIEHILNNPDCSAQDLLQYVKGPDFPSGGNLIQDDEAVQTIYSTGRGTLKLRAKYIIENFSHGMYQIVITELPYQVVKSKLIEKIAELWSDKKLPFVNNIRDESDENVRVIIEPKTRQIAPEILMESLYKFTDLEIRVNFNMNMLDENLKPSVMNLKEILSCFIKHRFTVARRKITFMLSKIILRIEILRGMMVAYLNLDELISIIRTEDEPKIIIMSKWSLSEVQAEAILNTRLKSLSKLEKTKIQNELNELVSKEEELQNIISSHENMVIYIKKENNGLKQHFLNHPEIGNRRTMQIPALTEIDTINIEDLIEKESITVICSKLGWIRSLKGHVMPGDIKYKDGDEEGWAIKCYNTDKIILFSSLGKAFCINADKIPRTKGNGDPISVIIDMESGESILDLFIYKKDAKYLLASSNAKGFVIDSQNFLAQTKSGKKILEPAQKHYCHLCKEILGDIIILIGENRKMLAYKVAEIPEMKKGQGVTLQKYKDGKISDILFIKENQEIFWSIDGKEYASSYETFLGKRGDAGKLAPRGFKKNNKF